MFVAALLANSVFLFSSCFLILNAVISDVVTFPSPFASISAKCSNTSDKACVDIPVAEPSCVN
jgi:hypothetical protein